MSRLPERRLRKGGEFSSNTMKSRRGNGSSRDSRGRKERPEDSPREETLLRPLSKRRSELSQLRDQLQLRRKESPDNLAMLRLQEARLQFNERRAREWPLSP